jgi:hypothetical protein
MRLLSLALSFVLAVSVVTVAVGYVADRVGQSRIEVQDGWISSSEPEAYQAYGQVASRELDSLRSTSAAEADTVGVR